MLRAPSAIWSAISTYYAQPGPLTWLNITAVLYSLPLILLAVVPTTVLGHWQFAPILIAILVGVMPNPAAAGLQYCARLVARGEEFTMVEARRALADYWKPASALYAFSLVALALIVANVLFYTSLNSPLSLVLDLIWTYFFFAWVGAQFYLYPMLFAVDRPSIPLIYRNAMVLAFMKPISTVMTMVVWLALIVFSSTTGLLLLVGLVLPAVMQQSLAQRLLPTVRVASSPATSPSAATPAAYQKSQRGTPRRRNSRR